HGAMAAKVASMQKIMFPRSAAHPDNKNGTASSPVFLNVGPNFAAKRARGKKLALCASYDGMTAERLELTAGHSFSSAVSPVLAYTSGIFSESESGRWAED